MTTTSDRTHKVIQWQARCLPLNALNHLPFYSPSSLTQPDQAESIPHVQALPEHAPSEALPPLMEAEAEPLDLHFWPKARNERSEKTREAREPGTREILPISTLLGFTLKAIEKSNPTRTSMTQLIYRGETIAYTLRPAKSHRKPYALNWRYQVAGATYDEPIPVVVYRKPQAINWRWSIREI